MFYGDRMTESEKQTIKDGYKKSIKDLAKLYRDNETRQRGRSFLLGCMESLQPYPVALGLLLSVFPSDLTDGLSVTPVFLDGKKPDGKMSDPEEKPGQKNQGRNPKTGNQVETDDNIVLHSEPVTPSEVVTSSDIIQPLKPSKTVLQPLQDDNGDLIPDDETRAKIEEYAHQINDISNTYISTIRNGDLKNPPSWFPDLIYYIVDRIEKPKHDIYLLDGLWQIYKRLCSRVGIVLMLQHFASLTSINPGTFSDWQAGQYRTASVKGGKLTPAFGEVVKKWRRECEAALSAEVTGKDGANINKIFILKSCYGYTESAPVQRVEVAAAAPSAYPVLGLAEKPENITNQS